MWSEEWSDLLSSRKLSLLCCSQSYPFNLAIEVEGPSVHLGRATLGLTHWSMGLIQVPVLFSKIRGCWSWLASMSRTEKMSDLLGFALAWRLRPSFPVKLHSKRPFSVSSWDFQVRNLLTSPCLYRNGGLTHRWCGLTIISWGFRGSRHLHLRAWDWLLFPLWSCTSWSKGLAPMWTRIRSSPCCCQRWIRTQLSYPMAFHTCSFLCYCLWHAFFCCSASRERFEPSRIWKP